MAFAVRGAVPLITFVIVVLSSMSLDSGAHAAERGIPKSAPAFTKFVGRSIQEAMPAAKVSVIGRLRLDVEAPNGGHTTDLHNIYSTCQRDPDSCGEEVTNFVAQMVGLYKAGDAVVTPDALRIIVRPSAYVAAARANTKRNRPLAVPLVGDLWMMAAIDRPTAIEIMDENDLGALKLSGNGAAKLAFANTQRELGKSLGDFAIGSCSGILTGDSYISSALLFLPLWAKAAHSCKDNLLVAVPARDVVLYADGTKPGAMISIVHDADEVMAHDDKPFSDSVFRWSSRGWVPVPPPARKIH